MRFTDRGLSMENNTQVLPNQESFLYGLPGIKKERVEGVQKTMVDMNALPPYCQFELIKTVLATLESMQFEDEKQQELIEALRTYLTAPEKPLDVQAAKELGAKIGLFLAVIIWLCGMFFACGYSPFVTNVFNFCKETAVYASFILPLTIGIAVMGVLSFCIPVAILTLLGSAIGWGIATGINKLHTHRHVVTSEKLLKNLISEINLLLETEPKETSAVAGCSRPGFFSAKKENDSAPTLGEYRTHAYSA